MKKKVSLKEIEVKSFVTNLEKDQQSHVKGKGGLPETMYSCYAYVTCDMVQCAVDGDYTVSTDDISTLA